MFKENKKYRIIESVVEDFYDEASINKKLHEKLNLSNWFTVLEVIDKGVKRISLENGKVVNADDFQIFVLFDEDEFKYFEQFEQTQEKVVIVEHLPYGPSVRLVRENEVEKVVEEFLNIYPTSKVEIFRLSETASLKHAIIYEICE
ncbi:hypothetical protein [Providencia phage PSTCR6]|nr:hypothetical protein [Providencia phage PSTCR6]